LINEVGLEKENWNFIARIM